jgi:hypothetical protein
MTLQDYESTYYAQKRFPEEGRLVFYSANGEKGPKKQADHSRAERPNDHRRSPYGMIPFPIV